MKTQFVRAVVVAASVAIATPLQAQYGAPASTSPIKVTPYVGYMIFGDYFDGPLGTSLTSKNAPVYGGQLELSLGRNVALVGNVGYSKSEWQVDLPIVGGLSLGDASVLLYDGSVQLKLPMGLAGASSVTPLVQVGAGAIRHSLDNSVVDASTTNFAFNAGLGLDYQVTRALGVRLMAKDYIGKLDLDLDLPDVVPGLDSKVAHNVVLSLGVNFGF
ncbi:MAG TPA: outer membrane beta-barrel protein [Gemmatimonadaceae bacterium]|nr:outer membrane beta-barrel protein [Gemmatimonadaceae bacterium]